MKTLYSSFWAFLLILFPFVVFAQPSGKDSLPVGRCGVTADYIQEMHARMTRQPLTGQQPHTTNITEQRDFPPALIKYCGQHFRLYYEDFINGKNRGFDDTLGGLGLKRRTTLCQVLSYIESVINIPQGVVLDLYIDSSFTASNPTLLSFLARAQPTYPPSLTISPGIYEGNLYNHIKYGNDPDTNRYDGIIQVNFYDTYTFKNIPYANDTTEQGCLYDLYTVLLHEITHVLGINSLIRLDPFPDDPDTAKTINDANGFSLFDDHLQYGDIQTRSFLKVVEHLGGSNYRVNPLVNAQPFPMGSFKIWFDTTGAPDNQPVFSGDITSREAYKSSYLSHLCLYDNLYAMQLQYSPGFRPNYVMGPIIERNDLRRSYTKEELRILQDLDYELTSSFLSSRSLNGIDENRDVLANSTPTNSKYPMEKTFLTDNFFGDKIAPDFIVQNNNQIGQTPTSSITIDLSLDTTLNDKDGDKISVKKGSLYNIRGCGLNGNNHDRLTLNNDSTQITYTPAPGFTGRAQFGFHLWDGHERGAFKVYTIDVTANYTVAIGDNLVYNSGFEEGTEVKTKGNSLNVPNPAKSEALYQEGMYYLGAVFGDGIYNTFTTRGVNANYIIQNSLSDCGINRSGGPFERNFGSINSTWELPNITVSYIHPRPVSNQIYPNNHRYTPPEGRDMTLIDPIKPSRSYRLSFDTHQFLQKPGSDVNVQVAVRKKPWLDFNTPVNEYENQFILPITDTILNHWTRVSFDFFYCGDSASYLSIKSPITFIDNVELVELVTAPPPTAYIVASAKKICFGDRIKLAAHSNIPSCSLTYRWSTGDTTKTISLIPPTSTIYTVTITNNGGVSASASVSITVTPSFTVFAGNDTTICAYTSISLRASSSHKVTYEWSFLDSSFIDTTRSVLIMLGTKNTTLQLVGILDGCRVADSISITVPPIVNAGPDLTICYGDTVTLGSTPCNGKAYQWTDTNGVIPNPIGPHAICRPRFLPDLNETYVVRMIDSLNCVSYDTVNVTVIPRPGVQIQTPSPSGRCNPQDTIQITTLISPTGGTIEWTPAAGLSNPFIANPKAYPKHTTLYTVTVRNSNGCVAQSSILIEVPYDTANVTIPGGTTAVWDNVNTTIKGALIIKSGANLTIRGSAIRFDYGDVVDENVSGGPTRWAKVLIEQGASLTIENTTLDKSASTGCPADWWDGVELLKRNVLTATETVNSDRLARFSSSAGSVINHAKKGVLMQRAYTIGGQTQQGFYAAGIVNATDTKFLNNDVAVDFNNLNIRSNLNVNNPSSFTTCTFAYTDDRPTAPPALIRLRGVKSGTIKNSLLDAEYTLVSQVYKAAYGVEEINSSVNLEDNTLRNCITGIEVKNAGTGESRSNVFKGNYIENTYQGLHLLASRNDIVTNNTFVINYQPPAGLDLAGIVADGATGFSLDSNKIEGTLIGPSGPGYNVHGMSFNTTGPMGGLLYSNNFSDTHCGVHIVNDNQNLKIRCNSFGHDGIAHPDGAWYLQDNGGTTSLKQQGSPLCNGNSAEGAGNTFMLKNFNAHDALCQSPYTGNGSVIDINNNANYNFLYYGNSSDVEGHLTSLPTCSSSGWLNYNTTATCDEPATITSCDDPDAGNIIAPGGNFPENCSTNKVRIQNAITALISQANVLQPMVIVSGMLANATSNNALKARIDELRKEANQLLAKLVRINSICETAGSILPSIEIYLSTNPLAEAKKILATRQLSEGKLLEARATLSVLSILNTTLVWNNNTEKTLIKTENSLFVQLMNIYIDAASTNRAILVASGNGLGYSTQLSSIEIAHIRSIAQNGTPTGYNARVLLNLLYNETINLPNLKHKPQVQSRKEPIENIQYKQTLIRLYPQPNNGHFVLEHTNLQLDAVLNVYTATGSLVTQVNISSINYETVVDLSNLSMGIYTYSLISGNHMLKKDKLVIIK